MIPEDAGKCLLDLHTAVHLAAIEAYNTTRFCKVLGKLACKLVVPCIQQTSVQGANGDLVTHPRISRSARSASSYIFFTSCFIAGVAVGVSEMNLTISRAWRSRSLTRAI